MTPRKRASSTNVELLIALEHHGLDAPFRSYDKPVVSFQPRHYHSKLTGTGWCGLSAYGLVVLAVLASCYCVAHSIGYLGFWLLTSS